jgi:glutamate 5-kinase
MQQQANRDRLAAAKRVVIKFGTRVLVDSRGRPNPNRIQAIVDQVARLVKEGREVVLVSSGAVGAGLDPLGYDRRPVDLISLQMAAAVGQTRLMRMYSERFEPKGIHVGQVLLNHDDLKQRNRHLNARNALLGLLRKGVVPIVNENDVVSVDEIRLGDNDYLAALVAVLVDADALLLATSVNGLRAPLKTGRTRRIPYLPQISQTELDLVFGKGSELSTGGMATKLGAAQMANKAGAVSVILDGRKADSLLKALKGEDVGTCIGRLGGAGRIRGKRKHWIAFFHKPGGKIQVDNGAEQALCRRGKSLLAAGITRVEGSFQTGAVVEVLNADGRLLGTGLSEFSSEDLGLIQGKKSNRILEILGPAVSTEVIHRDNLALLMDKETDDGKEK